MQPNSGRVCSVCVLPNPTKTKDVKIVAAVVDDDDDDQTVAVEVFWALLVSFAVRLT